MSREASFKEKVRSSEHGVFQALVDLYFVLQTCQLHSAFCL